MSSHPRYSIASLSLGSCLHHDLPTKIKIASQLGYDGIEIFIPDFESFVTEVLEGHHLALFSPGFNPHTFTSPALERACATALATFCGSHSLSIPVLQPLRNFENFATHTALLQNLDLAERWLALMPYFHTNLLLVCSNLIEGPHPITGVGGKSMKEYIDAQVAAFRLLGQRAAKYGVRVGYEPLAWGTVVDNWEQVWAVVKKVDMPNVGVILDSFNTLGNQYADPSHPTSIRPTTSPAISPISKLTQNLTHLTQTIPPHKLFLYQIADAQRPSAPIPNLPGAPARMTWSRASRLFPCERAEDVVPLTTSATLSLLPCDTSANALENRAGFLPVSLMTLAIHKTGYTGWWSLEVFNTSLAEADEECPRRHGLRGIKGLGRLWDEVQKLEVEEESEINEAARDAVIRESGKEASLNEGVGMPDRMCSTADATSKSGGVPDKSSATWYGRPTDGSQPLPSPSLGSYGVGLGWVVHVWRTMNIWHG